MKANEKVIIAGVAGVMVLVWFFRKQAGELLGAAGDTVGGVVSGNNALTEGTPYEGAGIFGTLGAAANEASGGLLGNLGSGLGGLIYDVFHPNVLDPNQRAFTAGGAARPEDKAGALRGY